MSVIISVLLRIWPYILFAGVVLWIGNSVFQSGVERERNRFAAKEAQIQIEIRAEENKLKEQIRKMEETQRSTIMEVQNDHAEETRKLNDTIRKLSSRGLYVTATRCENGRLPGTTENADANVGVSRAEGGKVRLSQAIERDLWEQVADAASVVELYRACRSVLVSPVCNIELVD